jgi:hypothetical protein
MKKISAKEFLSMVSENPAIFEHWDTPLEITSHVECYNSSIPHLSKYLIFSGKNKEGESADFTSCKSLKTATGTFYGSVNFVDSGVEKIENLTTGTNENGWAANFMICPNLKVATGTYPGCVYFARSGMERIENLTITQPNKDGQYADFHNCSNLHTLENWDLSKKIGIEHKKLKAERKRRDSLKKYIQESQPKPLPFL